MNNVFDEFTLPKETIRCYTNNNLLTLARRLAPDVHLFRKLMMVSKTVSGGSLEFVGKYLTRIDELHVDSYNGIDPANYIVDYSITGENVIETIFSNYRGRVSTVIDNMIQSDFSSSDIEMTTKLRKLVNDLFLVVLQDIFSLVESPIELSGYYTFTTTMYNNEYLYITRPKVYLY